MSRALDAELMVELGHDVQWLECIHARENKFWFVAPWVFNEEHLWQRRHDHEGMAMQPCYLGEDGYWEIVPFFSEDGNDMLALDCEMQKRGFNERCLFITGNNDYEMTYFKGDQCAIGRTSSEPLARAFAARDVMRKVRGVEKNEQTA